jgi:hypothetical protein
MDDDGELDLLIFVIELCVNALCLTMATSNVPVTGFLQNILTSLTGMSLDAPRAVPCVNQLATWHFSSDHNPSLSLQAHLCLSLIMTTMPLRWADCESDSDNDDEGFIVQVSKQNRERQRSSPTPPPAAVAAAAPRSAASIPSRHQSSQAQQQPLPANAKRLFLLFRGPLRDAEMDGAELQLISHDDMTMKKLCYEMHHQTALCHAYDPTQGRVWHIENAGDSRLTPVNARQLFSEYVDRVHAVMQQHEIAFDVNVPQQTQHSRSHSVQRDHSCERVDNWRARS